VTVESGVEFARELALAVSAYAGSRPVPLCVHARAESLRETEGSAMGLRRAHALNAVLEEADLPLWTGESLVGMGKACGRGVEGILTPEQLEADGRVCGQVGGRTFGSHSDHHAPGYEVLLREGLGGLAARVERELERRRPAAEKEFLGSVAVAVAGLRRYCRRWSERLARAAASDPHPSRRLEQAERMAALADDPPRTFADALQLVYTVNAALELDDRYAMAFGRMDQYLWPFCRRDLEPGTASPDEIQGLLDEFFAKVTVDGDVHNIAIGGVVPETGADATNDLSWMILEACKRIGRPGGNITARIHSGTPAGFLEKCVDVIRTGIGYPALFNDDIQIPAMVHLGFPLEHARDYCFVGCIEIHIPGRMAPWADSRFNLAGCVNLALFRGEDLLSGSQIGPDTGDVDSWDSLCDAVRVQMQAGIREHVMAMNRIKEPFDREPAQYTSPLLSAFVEDCIGRGRDLNDGGALYPANHGIAAMGIGTAADSMAALKHLVFDQGRFSLDQVRQMLRDDFDGWERERQALLNHAPKYGNDDEAVDSIARDLTRDVGNCSLAYRTPQGGQYWILMAANISNIYAGRELGATPDGRRSQEPLSDAASPTFGRDRKGLTGTVRSIAKLPYDLCPGGNVVNVKLHPSTIAGQEGCRNLAALVRTCFDLGGIQLQFNTVAREMLMDAMDRPEAYAGLVVRVSGFSALFTTLPREVQQDILARTEHRQL
jgi:formate C-acetyltransferase